MKAKPVSFIVIFLFSLSLSTLNSYAFFQNIKKETRDVGTFESIGLGISADLYLTQGSKTELILEAEADILERIETDVKNGKLRIYFEKWRTLRYKRVKIYITTPTINGLSVSGSGDIIAQTPIETDNISFSISGSGSINIEDLVTGDVGSSISGSGTIQLGGSESVASLDLSISGSGKLVAENLEVEEFSGRISGSGSCKVFVTSTLDVSISGSGNVYYRGNPVIDARISGSGEVITLK